MTTNINSCFTLLNFWNFWFDLISLPISDKIQKEIKWRNFCNIQITTIVCSRWKLHEHCYTCLILKRIILEIKLRIIILEIDFILIDNENSLCKWIIIIIIIIAIAVIFYYGACVCVYFSKFQSRLDRPFFYAQYWYSSLLRITKIQFWHAL